MIHNQQETKEEDLMAESSDGIEASSCLQCVPVERDHRDPSNGTKKPPYFIASKDSSTLPSVSYLRPTLQLAQLAFPQASSPTPTPSNRQVVNPRNHTVSTHDLRNGKGKSPRLRKSTPYSHYHHYLTATPIAEVLWRCLISVRVHT